MTRSISTPRWCAGLGALALAAGCGPVRDGEEVDGGVDAPPGAATTVFAPYFYTWGWGSPAYAFSSLQEMRAEGGPAAVTLAFVVSDGGGCEATRDIANNLADVRAYVAAGGRVRASFGGAIGTYLETACASPGELAAAIGRFIDATGITDLDLDVEQRTVSSNPAVNARRAAALKQLQDERQVRVSFTMPVAPTGLLQDSLDVIAAAVDAGVTVDVVNAMTMDYGDGTDLGTTPIRSLEAMAGQLRELLPGTAGDAVYRHMGVTPMIGKNDDEETFTLANARTLLEYARDRQLGLVSFWAIQRDQVCPPGDDVAVCSRVNTRTFEFAQLFAGVATP